MSKITEFNKLGQSIWSDYLRRSFIESGELQKLIDLGLSGITANPTIFEKAISGSKDYDSEVRRYAEERRSIRETYELLALEDISKSSDVLKPVYDSRNGGDGFVSIEVDPKLANDTKGMVDEAIRFFKKLNRPNVMIKIPATKAGFPAIKTLTASGINVNVTLIFSQRQYESAAEAYISGLEELAKTRDDLSKVSSVASFFVSRVDTKVDAELEKKMMIEGEDLKGKIGIANAKIAYAKFEEIFSGPRWEKLKSKGARVQRVLWASTSTKNPTYPDTLYVDNLCGPQTVNTLPPNTIQALLDHGHPQDSLHSGLDEARREMKRLAEVGIDFGKITEELEDEGIEKFSKSLDSLFDKLSQKRERLLSEPDNEPAIKSQTYREAIDSALNKLSTDEVVRRIWNHDYTLWKSDPKEIANRLGWLDSPSVIEENLQRILEFVDEVKASGFTHALLLGMGGSSLAPEMFSKVFGTKEGFLTLSVLDNTDPSTVEATLKGLDLGRTLFIVSSKSGKTVETMSLFKFFYNRELDDVREKRRGGIKIGEDGEKREVGQHFVAITDPKSPLDEISDKCRFRSKFLNDPNIGGRYSALSYYGLVPAALIGMDIPLLLDNGLTMASSCESSVDIKDNPGAWLGAILGDLETRGVNKLTLVTSPRLEGLSDWIEQLIAESTGKEERGILPIVGEKLGAPDKYGKDRLFVHIRLARDDDSSSDKGLDDLESNGFLVVRLPALRDVYEIGKTLFQWEFATAVAGHIIGINPFDQPNVEASKELSRKMIAMYQEKGTFPPEAPSLVTPEGIRIYGHDTKSKEAGRALLEFIDSNRKGGSYIALNSYLQDNLETYNLLQKLRTNLRDRYKLATTLGFGPRFLHSTGQLHKGDSGSGLIVQITSSEEMKHEDIPIPREAGSPESSVGFGVLTLAEALGNRKTLADRGRNVIRIDLGRNIHSALNTLLASTSKEGHDEKKGRTVEQMQQKRNQC